jgi:folate-binding protein YgfZ
MGGRPGEAEVLGAQVPRRRGDPTAEAQAIREGAALLAAPWERVLEVTGPDAAGFLHVLLTQHVRGLAVGTAAPAALATRKGHLVADLTVFRSAEDRFLLRVAAPFAEALRAQLESHRILEDVDFGWRQEGPGAHLLVGPLAAQVATEVARHPAFALLLPIREITSEDRLLLPSPDGEARLVDACVHAGARVVGWDAFDRRRIELGRAWFGLDADGDRLVPEPGFDDRIHYDKGCYLGQEPLARLHFRGRPNWGLVLLFANERSPLVAGVALRDAEGEEVGWVTSVAPEPSTADGAASGTPETAGTLALGFLHRRFRESGAAEVHAADGPTLGWRPATKS